MSAQARLCRQACPGWNNWPYHNVVMSILKLAGLPVVWCSGQQACLPKLSGRYIYIYIYIYTYNIYNNIEREGDLVLACLPL